MDAVTENSIRQEQMESFGRLMAGFSHDMKNHLGTIREANGLMSDLLAMGGLDDNEPLVQRFTKAMASIEKRVVIAAGMLHHLSALAHRSDIPLSSFQVNDLLTEACTFLERFTRLKQVGFSLEPGKGLPTICNDPALLIHIFHRLHCLCLERLDAGRSLVVITRENQKTVEIVFRLACTLENPEKLFSGALQAAVEKIGGRLETENHSEDTCDVVLVVPSLSSP